VNSKEVYDVGTLAASKVSINVATTASFEALTTAVIGPDADPTLLR
jgi:hypothetical protein